VSQRKKDFGAVSNLRDDVLNSIGFQDLDASIRCGDVDGDPAIEVGLKPVNVPTRTTTPATGKEWRDAVIVDHADAIRCSAYEFFREGGPKTEDAYSLAILKVYEELERHPADQFDTGGLKAWVQEVASNAIKNHLKAERLREHVSIDAKVTSPSGEDGQEYSPASAVDRAVAGHWRRSQRSIDHVNEKLAELESVSARQRQVIDLMKLGYARGEIAKSLGIAPESVSRILATVRRRIQKVSPGYATSSDLRCRKATWLKSVELDAEQLRRIESSWRRVMRAVQGGERAA